MLVRFFCFFVLLSFSQLFGDVVWSAPLAENSVCSIAVNDRGDAVAAWYNRVENSIELKNYDFVTNKFSSTMLASYPRSGEVDFLHVSINREKEITVAWIDETFQVLKVATFYDGIWSNPWVLKDAHLIRHPLLKRDRLDNLVVVWEGFNGQDYQVYAACFLEKKREWIGPIALSAAGFSCDSSTFEFNANGEVIVAWCAHSHFSKDEISGLQAVKLDIGFEKTTQILSLFETHFSLEKPVIGFDQSDHIFFVWQKRDLDSDETKIQSLSVSSKWHKLGKLKDISDNGALLPSFVKLSGGDIFAMWKQDDGSKQWLQSYQLNRTFHKPVDISYPLKTISGYKVLADKYGKMKVVYFNDEQIYVAQYDEIWEESCLFYGDRATTDQIVGLQIESDAMGNALIAWTKNSGTFFSQGDYLLPPTDFVAQKVIKKLPTKKIVRAYLSWTPSQNPSIMRYRIRRNGDVIGEALTSEFVDRNCPKGDLIYSISSINDKELESQTSEVLFRN